MATTDVAFFFFHLSCSKEHETHLTTPPPCPEPLQAIHETVWPSWTHQSKIIPKSLHSRDYSSLSLSFAPLRPFCLPAAGASCDPGPLSCTHGGNEGCWAACGFAGESLGGLSVCVRAKYGCMLCSVKRLNAAFCPPTAAAVCVPPFLCLNLCCCGCLCPSPVRRPQRCGQQSPPGLP